jgi:hypothetical protein
MLWTLRGLVIGVIGLIAGLIFFDWFFRHLLQLLEPRRPKLVRNSNQGTSIFRTTVGNAGININF